MNEIATNLGWMVIAVAIIFLLGWISSIVEKNKKK